MVHSSTIISRNTKMFYYSEKKCKTWANIFMENNVKQITSNFLLETTCVNYKPNSSTQ